MCFSPEADLVTGVTVGVIGIDAMRHVARPRELVFAAVPLVLGVHQLDEVLVWWGQQGHVPASWNNATIGIYLLIAFLLPTIVPLAILGIEPPGIRQNLISLFAVVGIGVSAILATHVLIGPIGAVIEGHHLAYSANLGGPAVPLTILYVITTCGSLLAAGDRRMVIYGVTNLVVVANLAWLTVSGLTSLWCAWAALTSVAVAAYLRHLRALDETGQAGVIGPLSAA
jgi:hypothetical protein